MLKVTVPFVRGVATNSLLRYAIYGLQGVGFLPAPSTRFDTPGDVALSPSCLDSEISVSRVVTTDMLSEGRIALLTDVLREMLYAFNHTDANLEEVFKRCCVKLVRASRSSVIS
jgi:hypothetical protein